MQTTTTTKTNEHLFLSALDMLWDYYNKIDSEDSNEHFNALHDSLRYQLQGFGYIADNEKINDRDLNEIIQFLKEIKEYYKTSQKLKEPNWIFG